ncbi:MAG: serine hydrolase [Sphingobacteriales bacterium]|nr:serine hydrolase [Sphingobacteriales bacterium]MBI3720059.1 serine hydrolase [Sphingobacteriales bacterium]
MKQLMLSVVYFICVSMVIAQNTESVQKKIEGLIKEAATKDVFSGSVLVVQNNKPVYDKSIGLADMEKNISNTTDTKFSLGSITKIFTKALVLKLIEEGKIQADEKIVVYLPGFTDERAAEITIEQLMEHTSGLGDYAGAPGWDMTSEEINNISQMLAHIQKQPLLFKPGTNVQYSNSGYAVLAALIEKVTGKKLGDVYKEKIFDKLNMTNTGFAEVNRDRPGKAIGYLTNFIGTKRNNLEFKEMGAGDGGLYSTTGDLWKFAQSIVSDNKLLKDESKLKLFNTSLFPVHYANWKECKEKGRLSIAGGAPGVSAVMGINMEKNYFFAVLSNYDEGSAEIVAQRISAILNNRELTPLPLPPARFIYSLIKEKGPANFISNYKEELKKANIELEDDMILLSVGQKLLEEKNADEALALYSVYTKEFPNIVVAWNDMGDAYLLKADKTNAKKCFEQALKLRPGNPRAQRMLKELQ